MTVRKALPAIFVLAWVVAANAYAPASRAPGVYLRVVDDGGGERLQALRGSMVHAIERNTTPRTGIAGGSIEGELPGAAAAVRARGGDVAFEFFFDEHAGSAGAMTFDDPQRMMSGDYMPPMARNGEEFALLRLAPTPDNRRRVQMGATGRDGLPGRSKDRVAFTAVMTGPQTFVGRLATPLAPGEYALMWAPDGLDGQIWDFGIDPK
jgi:hypothetical protein